MLVLIRSVWPYAAGAFLPILIGLLWPRSSSAYPVHASVFFLCVAVVARFLGFAPALLCTLSSALTLWRVVLATSVYPHNVQIIRVLLFTMAALVLASISRQRSKDVREAEERMRALFDTAMDAILFVDADGRYIDANPAATALMGYSRKEMIGRNVGDFSPIEDRERTMEISQSVMTEGRGSGEAAILRKDGNTLEIEYRSVSNVRPGVHFVMMHDITARKAAERSLHQVSGRLLHLQDDERRRIARQLHDNTAQSLAAIRLNLARISRSPAVSSGAVREAVDESISLVEQSIGEVRTLAYLLHPPMIDEAGLLPSLRWFLRGFEQRSGVMATLDAPEDLGRLSQELETAIFRIVQEALTNVQRHSGSMVARIGLQRNQDDLRLEIEDEGHGMPVELRENHRALAAAGLGIAGIQERVRDLGGQTEIQSGDRGTRILVILPIPEA